MKKQPTQRLIVIGIVILLLCGFALPLVARQPFPPPPPKKQARETLQQEADLDIPELTWFKGETGYEEAQALQKQTGADMFVLFYNLNDKSEKGLFKWLENRGLKTTDVRTLLRDYIKVKIRMNKKATREIAQRDFMVKSTPATYLVWSNGWTRRCQFFDWSGTRPRLENSETMARIILTNSSEHMQQRIATEK
jgi:hypothetical protein